MYQQLCEELGSTPNYGGGRGGLDQKFWNEHHRNLEGRRKEQENRRKRSK